jgi:hypothetical protein
MPSHLISSRLILISSCHLPLDLPSCLAQISEPKIMCAFLLSYVQHAQPIPFRKIPGEAYKPWSSSLWNFLYSLVTPQLHGKVSCFHRHSIFVIPWVWLTKCHTHTKQSKLQLCFYSCKKISLCLINFKASPSKCNQRFSLFFSALLLLVIWAGSRRLAEWNWKVVAVPRWLLLSVVAFFSYQSRVSSVWRPTPPSR